MSLEIPVFSAILRHRCPHCCSCIVRDFYLFSPFPTAKKTHSVPSFPIAMLTLNCDLYTNAACRVVSPRWPPVNFLASKIRQADIREALSMGVTYPTISQYTYQRSRCYFLNFGPLSLSPNFELWQRYCPRVTVPFSSLPLDCNIFCYTFHHLRIQQSCSHKNQNLRPPIH